jgi:broad specificity phosphatase PhoE
MPKTRIILVRHGETEWNVEQRFRGHHDIPLNETGITQAKALSRRLADEPVAAVYTSCLQRASHTAEIIAVPHGLTPISEASLANINYGDLEGLTITEVSERYPEMYNTLMHTPQLVRFPFGDTLDDLTVRGMNGIQSIIARHKGQTVIAVSHQVITRVLRCAMLGLDNSHHWNVTQDTACMNVVHFRRGQFYIDLLNDTCHLRDDGCHRA